MFTINATKSTVNVTISDGRGKHSTGRSNSKRRFNSKSNNKASAFKAVDHVQPLSDQFKSLSLDESNNNSNNNHHQQLKHIISIAKANKKDSLIDDPSLDLISKVLPSQSLSLLKATTPQHRNVQLLLDVLELHIRREIKDHKERVKYQHNNSSLLRSITDFRKPSLHRVCYKCNQPGHLARFCRSEQKK